MSEKNRLGKLVDKLLNTNSNEKMTKAISEELKVPEKSILEYVDNGEELVTIDTEEMVKFISDELKKMSISLSDENILNVLDLELEFLNSKGIIE